MSETETDLDAVVDSPDTGDTDTAEGHTSETASSEQPDIDALLTQLETLKDKIPAEKLQFLNPNLQAGYTRRLNLLNKGASTAVETIVKEAGVQIPEGKTALDLLTDNEGKDFFKLIRGQVAEEVKPLTDMAASQRNNENIRTMIGVAVENFPEVKENVQDVITTIDGDPELTKLSQAYGGNALPYVMRGVAAVIVNERLKAENKRLTGILDAAKIATKVGTGTSRAGGQRPTSAEQPPPGKGRLDWAMNKASERMETEQ